MPLLFVAFAHVCGLHFFLRQALNKANGFNLFQRTIIAFFFLGLVYIAIFSIIILSAIAGVLSLFIFKFPVVGFSLSTILCIGLLSAEALNIYYQFFKNKSVQFSIKNFSLSLALSTGVFVCTALVVWLISWYFIKEETFPGA